MLFLLLLAFTPALAFALLLLFGVLLLTMPFAPLVTLLTLPVPLIFPLLSVADLTPSLRSTGEICAFGVADLDA
jgi:hypothetical protein